MHSAPIHDPKHVLAFLLAGRAHVSFRSERTGMHFTYSVLKNENRVTVNGASHFVAVLSRPEHYDYIGSIFNGLAFSHTSGSRIGRHAKSVVAFSWVWKHISGGKMPPECEVWHEGRCSKCGRELTDPESIARGIGPTCLKAAGM